MLVLAFDTCFSACSAAVLNHRAGASTSATVDVVAFRDEPMAVGHAERLMPMIRDVMAEAHVAFADLGAIAVTVGPGTFTGVRTGISAARGLALASGLPVLGMTSLELFARTADAALGDEAAAASLVVCMDAGKGQVYAQAFGPRAPGHAIDVDRARNSEPMLATAEKVALVVSREPTVIVGSAAATVVRLAADNGGLARAGWRDGQSSARHMHGGWLAMSSPVRPLYVRLPDAIPQADKSLPRVTP